MENRLLRSEEDVSRFAGAFARLCRNPVGTDYFIGADRVRAFFKARRMVGGYVVNAQAPLRYHAMIPEPQRASDSLEPFFAAGEACEIACFWLIRARLTSQERNYVYLRSAVDALAMGTRWIIGGSVSAKLARTQKRVLPRVLYTGPWDFHGSPTDAEIYCASWWQLLGLIAVAYSWTSTRDWTRRTWAALRGRRTRWC